MSDHSLPIVEPSGQAVLLEVEPVTAAVKPPKQKAARDRRPRQQEPEPEVEKPAAAEAPGDGSPDPDARSLLADLLPKWALERAQQELSNAAPVRSVADEELPLD